MNQVPRRQQKKSRKAENQEKTAKKKKIQTPHNVTSNWVHSQIRKTLRPDDRRLYALGQSHPSAAATRRLLPTSVAPTPISIFDIAKRYTCHLSPCWVPTNLPFALMRDRPAPSFRLRSSVFRVPPKRGDHLLPLSWPEALDSSKLYLSSIY